MYHLFAFNSFDHQTEDEPPRKGGMDDYAGTFDTLELAKAHANATLGYMEQCQVVQVMPDGILKHVLTGYQLTTGAYGPKPVQWHNA